jgi:hypothetical protein
MDFEGRVAKADIADHPQPLRLPIQWHINLQRKDPSSGALRAAAPAARLLQEPARGATRPRSSTGSFSNRA